jgi:NADH-quinone oxidoreductase subunit M
VFVGLLTTLVFLPAAAAVIIALFLKEKRQIRMFAGIVAVAELALSIVAFASYDTAEGGVQLVDRISDWIPALNAQYFLGLDGLNAPMVLLTGLLGACAIFVSWSVQNRVKEYFMWLLLLWTAVMGVFVALDFLLFFIFWEIELIPMYMLISMWGTGRPTYSAMKFVAFTFLGSAFMLVAILALYFATGTFDMIRITQELGYDTPYSRLIMPAAVTFFFFFAAFAVKLPIWPVHTWLPDAHTDAPTAVSVMLAGVLLKMGGYGILRVCLSIFPDVARDYGTPLAILAAFSILYGAVVTLRQTDLKRLVAYSSVSHMGFVLLGVTSVSAVGGGFASVGITGASVQMFTHGTITGLLFVLVGLVYEKVHTRHIPDIKGLASRVPFVAVSFVIAGLASLGLPGLSGFVAEIMIFLGAFKANPWPVAFAAFGVVLAAGYILWTLQRILFGPPSERHEGLTDASWMEKLPIVALVIAIVVVGVYPAVITDVLDTALPDLINFRMP